MALNAPYTPNTVIQSTQVSNDLLGLADGSNDVTANKLATFRDEAFQDFVVSGLSITGDSLGVNRNASMASGVICVSGLRVAITAVSARTYTASKDTYVDITSGGTVVYTEVSNNAASPALVSGSIRIGIVVTGATTIAAATSINQGQETMVLPIATSVPYSVSDSLGNLICPRDPNNTTLGYRQKISNQTTSGASQQLITEFSVPVIIPTLRKIVIEIFVASTTPTTAFSDMFFSIWDGTVGSGTKLQEIEYYPQAASSTRDGGILCRWKGSYSGGAKTFNGGFKNSNVGSAATTIQASATEPAYMSVELR